MWKVPLEDDEEKEDIKYYIWSLHGRTLWTLGFEEEGENGRDRKETRERNPGTQPNDEATKGNVREEPF